jgi:hypothetical protein
MFLLTQVTLQIFPQLKETPQVAKIFIVILLGGLLSACGGSGGSDSSSDHSITPPPHESTLYLVEKGRSDYHQAFDLTETTTYYWKVIATNTRSQKVMYESEIYQFTTESF